MLVFSISLFFLLCYEAFTEDRQIYEECVAYNQNNFFFRGKKCHKLSLIELIIHVLVAKPIGIVLNTFGYFINQFLAGLLTNVNSFYATLILGFIIKYLIPIVFKLFLY